MSPIFQCYIIFSIDLQVVHSYFLRPIKNKIDTTFAWTILDSLHLFLTMPIGQKDKILATLYFTYLITQKTFQAQSISSTLKSPLLESIWVSNCLATSLRTMATLLWCIGTVCQWQHAEVSTVTTHSGSHQPKTWSRWAEDGGSRDCNTRHEWQYGESFMLSTNSHVLKSPPRLKLIVACGW